MKDQLGNTFEKPTKEMRIISLVPSITELLFDLGLSKQIIGRTKFCIYPKEAISSIKTIGGTKNCNIENIKRLQPDIIIANKEENNQEQVSLLQEHFPVWITNVISWEDQLEMIHQLSLFFNKKEEGQSIIELLNNFQKTPPFSTTPRIAYFIWKSPYMFAGDNTFINTIIEKINGKNIIHEERYPTISIKEINKRNPDFLFLSSEPYPFKEKDLPAIQRAFPNAKPIIIDGTYFSWYGSRMTRAEEYLVSLTKQMKKSMHIL